MIQSPYQQNVEILKDFFRKPIILVFSILTFFSVALQAVSHFVTRIPLSVDKVFLQNNIPYDNSSVEGINNSLNSMGSFNIFTILLAVSFLLFYLFSKKQDKTLAVPSMMFKIVSLIELILSILVAVILLAVIVILAIVAAFYSNSEQARFPEFMTALLIVSSIILIPLCAVLLLGAISKFLFANSIRKSLTSIYLKKTGAVLFGIMCFFSAAGALAVSFLSFGLVAYYQSMSPTVAMPVETGIMLVLQTATGIVTSVTGGIIAIKYASYIKSVSQRFQTETIPVDVPEPVPAAANFASGNPYENYQPVQAEIPQAPVREDLAVPPMAPAEPAPQEASVVQEAPAVAQAPVEDIQTPAIQSAPETEEAPQPVEPAPVNPEPERPSPRFCTQCGSPVKPGDHYCNLCGSEIKYIL